MLLSHQNIGKIRNLSGGLGTVRLGTEALDSISSEILNN